VATTVVLDGKTTPGTAGMSLYACAEALGVHVPTSCFGQGKCRECLVEVEAGMELLGPRTPEEEALDEGFRLSCRTRLIEGDGTVRCHTLRRGAMRIETEGVVTVTEEALDPAVTREGGKIVRDGQVLSEEDGPVLGLAVDVGTTTVALRLVDLETGAALATHSFENPQRFGGTDVMARIRFDGEHGGRLLQRTLLGYLAHAIEALPCDSTRIFEVVVAGNATMRDLFFGLDVQGIGQFPYRSVTQGTQGTQGTEDEESTGLVGAPRKLRLPVHPQAHVVGLPLVAGHVGADTSAALLATGVGLGPDVQVLMDIGTNTEVVIGNETRILAASCPAGPAFEGGAIRNGMPGLEGAIEHVALGDDGAPTLGVIGDGPPEGICGSGLVELLGELLRTERMNTRGRLTGEDDRFLLDAERDVGLSELDINELAQAKGANAAGLRAVFDLFGAQEIVRFHLAGGFARHIDLDAARRIGLVPDLPDDRFLKVGNASLEGAALALCSRARRAELEERVRRVEHVSLEQHPSFFDFFVDGCQFQPFGPGGGDA
jgi:uncharacterized 2Fe-2S/4Fe-4S cluster protein (DUF4445 family)